MTLKLLPTRAISLSSTLSHLVHPQCGYNARTVHFPLVLACHAELPIGCYFSPLKSSSYRRVPQSRHHSYFRMDGSLLWRGCFFAFQDIQQYPRPVPTRHPTHTFPQLVTTKSVSRLCQTFLEREARLPSVKNHCSGVKMPNCLARTVLFQAYCSGLLFSSKCLGLCGKLWLL